MREYGKLYSGFWTSSDTQSMSDDGKLLAAYLLTCHHSTIIGCFRLPDGYVSDDLGWSLERVAEGFVELFDKGFATRDNSSKWVVIHKYVKWNQPENPNQLKAATKAFNQVPNDCGVKPVLARSLADFCNGFDAEILKPFLNPSATVAKPVVVAVAVAVEKSIVASKAADTCPHEAIIDLYHQHLPTLPQVKVWTDSRRRLLKARWSEDSKRQNLEWWEGLFKYIATLPFMLGENDRGWQADIDHILTLKSFVKIIEGSRERVRKAA